MASSLNFSGEVLYGNTGEPFTQPALESVFLAQAGPSLPGEATEALALP